MTDAQHGWVVGANAHCTPAFYATSDGGKTWTAGSLSGVWVPVGNRVRTPTGSTTSPCGSRAGGQLMLAPSGPQGALVICADGVFRTSSGGHSWAHAGRLPAGQPVAAAVTPAGRGVLLLNEAANCDGLRMELTTDVGVSWSAGQCLTGVLPPVAVTMTSQGYGLVTTSDAVLSTNDSGRTWS